MLLNSSIDEIIGYVHFSSFNNRTFHNITQHNDCETRPVTASSYSLFNLLYIAFRSLSSPRFSPSTNSIYGPGDCFQFRPVLNNTAVDVFGQGPPNMFSRILVCENSFHLGGE